MSALFAVMATAACSVGNDDGAGPGAGSGSDDRDTKLGILCNASFKLTGTFTPGTPGRPLDPETNTPVTGCWPVGKWEFTAVVSDNECAKPPAVLAKYSFQVDRMDNGVDGLTESYTNLSTLGDIKAHIAVSSNGQGCEGSFELGSADGKDYWNMQPTLLNTPEGMPPSTALSGSGDYSEYNANAWPW